MVSESAEFILGSSVSGRDGPCGELTGIVVDPGPRTVTHLVVKPPQRGEAARLVPVRLAPHEVRDLPAAGPAPGEQ